MFDEKPKLVAVVLCLSIAGCLSNRTPVEGDLARIHATEFVPIQNRIVDQESMSTLSRIYRTNFVDPLQHRGTLSDEDVEAGYQAAYYVAFYALYHDPDSQSEFLDNAVLWLDELHRRGKFSNRHALFAHHMFFTARQFDRAEMVRSRNPDADLPPKPPIVVDQSFDPAQPGVYSLDDDGRGFHLNNVRLALDHTIIVIAGCPLSRQAAHDIQADPTLQQAFERGNVIWLGSADALDLDQINQWNTELPHSRLLVVHDQQQWPSMIDFTTHPSFHFFVDGKLVGSSSGWSPLGAPDEVIAGLNAMGVMPDPR